MENAGAVLTADIVNSSHLHPSEANQLREKLETRMHQMGVTRYYFYRGDSFQCYVPEMESAFRLALILRTEARLFEKGSQQKTDLKVSIGIGSVDLPEEDIKTAKGTAFVLSGRGLDELDRSGRRLSIASENLLANIAFGAISLFSNYLFDALTLKQAEVLLELLQKQTQRETAQKLHKSQPTVNRQALALGWAELEALMDLYQKTVQQVTPA
jgi:hypothetical protein